MSKPLLNYTSGGYQGLSYSRLCTLHLCPRKFQIENAFGLKEQTDTVTFAFGHAVGAGIQEWFTTQSYARAVVAAVKAYTMPWDVTGTLSEQRAKKNVWYAIAAITSFTKQITSLLSDGVAENNLSCLQEWELAFVTHPETGELVSSVELMFRINLPAGFTYEGHIDLAIRNKRTGEYAVLELKTSGFTAPGRALYGKSGQALAYSLVLDRLAGSARTSYRIFYLIWSSPSQRFFLFEFTKTPKQRLNWMNDVLRDTDLLTYYQQCADNGIPYPLNGASCYQFMKECEYYTTCEMEDSSLKLIYQGRQSFDYQEKEGHPLLFTFNYEDILQQQIEKAADHTGLPLLTTGNTNDQLIEL